VCALRSENSVVVEVLLHFQEELCCVEIDSYCKTQKFYFPYKEILRHNGSSLHKVLIWLVEWPDD
jgi:hypothetical protein